VWLQFCVLFLFLDLDRIPVQLGQNHGLPQDRRNQSPDPDQGQAVAVRRAVDHAAVLAAGHEVVRAVVRVAPAAQSRVQKAVLVPVRKVVEVVRAVQKNNRAVDRSDDDDVNICYLNMIIIFSL
jgi:predicted amino acid dehydrogenase